MLNLFEKIKTNLGFNKNPELEEELKLDKEIERLLSLESYEEEIAKLKMYAMLRAIVNGKAEDLEEAEKYVTADDLDIEKHIEKLKAVSQYKKEQRKLEKQKNTKKTKSKKTNSSSFNHVPFSTHNDDDYYNPYDPYNRYNNPLYNFEHQSNTFSEVDKYNSSHVGKDLYGHDVYRNHATGEYTTVDSCNTIINSQYHEPCNIQDNNY